MPCRLIAILGLCVLAACSHRQVADSSPEPVLPFSGVIDIPGPGDQVWGENCLIHRPCEAIEPLPLCPRDIQLATFPLPMATSDEVVLNVAGRLLDSALESTLAGCYFRCCNSTAKVAVLAAEGEWGFTLPNIGCFGDESRLCCNVIAVGQHVVARGRVRLESGPRKRAYFNGNVTLCAL